MAWYDRLVLHQDSCSSAPELTKMEHRSIWVAKKVFPSISAHRVEGGVAGTREKRGKSIRHAAA